MAVDPRTVGGLAKLLGPWFLLEPNAPSAPGVNWDKFRLQIQKGKVTPLSVVRGPTSQGLWRYAADTPAVATELGLCWSCQVALPDKTASRCPRCGLPLNSLPGMEEEAAGGRESSEHAAPGGRRPPPPPPLPVAQIADDRPAVPDYLKPAGPPAELVAPPATQQEAKKQESTASAVFTVLFIVVAAVLAVAVALAVIDRLKAKAGVRVNDPYPGAGRVASPSDNVAQAADSPSHVAQPPSTGSPARVERAAFTPSAVAAMSAGQTASAPTSTSAPANLTPEEAAHQKQQCADVLAKARQTAAAGDLRAAEKLLVEMLNTHFQDVWPEGAVDLLKQVQTRITTQPAGLPPAELARQKDAAAKLYQQAQAQMKKGDYDKAVNTLVTILNDYDQSAWPPGAKADYDTLTRDLKTPASRPKFFGVESKK